MDRLPDRSSLTRLRQRWGAERYRHLLVRTMQGRMLAGLAMGELVHLDNSLLRADASRDAILRTGVPRLAGCACVSLSTEPLVCGSHLVVCGGAGGAEPRIPILPVDFQAPYLISSPQYPEKPAN